MCSVGLVVTKPTNGRNAAKVRRVWTDMYQIGSRESTLSVHKLCVFDGRGSEGRVTVPNF
jgi:hypothetical protein